MLSIAKATLLSFQQQFLSPTNKTHQKKARKKYGKDATHDTSNTSKTLRQALGGFEDVVARIAIGEKDHSLKGGICGADEKFWGEVLERVFGWFSFIFLVGGNRVWGFLGLGLSLEKRGALKFF